MRAYLIRVYNGPWHGEIETEGSLQSMYERLDVKCIDIAVREIGGKAYNIICDDEGLLVDRPRVSAVMGTRRELVGNLLIFGMDDQLGDIDSLTDWDIWNIQQWMRGYVDIGSTPIMGWPCIRLGGEY